MTPYNQKDRMKNLADISPAQLRRAADIREQVDNLAHELHVIFGLSEPPAKKKTWSEARRKKFDRTISKRGAIIRPVGFDSDPENNTSIRGQKTTRRMSHAARAKISAAAKKRWKKAKAAGNNSL